MKTKTIISLLFSWVLGGMLLPTASANHRTGDFPLPELMSAGDFNQDGKLDLAVNVAGFDIIAILTGDGQGGFKLQGHIEADTLPKAVVTNDLNSDGHLDLVTINKWGYNIKVSLGNGLGGFSLARELNGDGEPTRILAGDVNHDGRLDLIANAPTEGKILIYFGDGRGGFSNTAIELEDLPSNFGLATGDFNRDNNLDIAVTKIEDDGPTGSHLIILLGDGAGGYTPSADVVVNPNPVSLAVSDLNRDGNLDVIVGGAGPENTTGNFLSTFVGDGAGHLSLKQTLDLGTGSLGGDLGLSDFDEDGNLDVAFPVDTLQTEEKSTEVLTFFGDGSGNLTAGPILTVGTEPHTVVAKDFNQDGHVDLAVTNRTDATVSILLGDGSGAFATHATIPVAVLPAP